MLEVIFWVSLLLVVYSYFGYPIFLYILGVLGLSKQIEKGGDDYLPAVTLLIPAHNEQDVLEAKLQNCLELTYAGPLQIVVVSDGSEDDTVKIANKYKDISKNIAVIVLPIRKGKANALNAGFELVQGEIVVFTDSSIILGKDAIHAITRQFKDASIGCVSGEDHIAESGGEGLYGRYELFLRNQESRFGSIVGASGSFYAQRWSICSPFVEGVAPDFLSVLLTVSQGYRATTESSAIGQMSAVKGARNEFQRKVRTLIRGMAALFQNKHLLNPFRYPLFSFFLWSHKLMRWFVPFFLLTALLVNIVLVTQPFYLVLLILQIIFYIVAFLAYTEILGFNDTLAGKIALYFTVVNLAILKAWMQYLAGVRQEIWTPSQRGGL
jgi:cellulose synthase/poly-beta-1,6-N-acetylglucosamine synthase-like glycosyltransferase